MRSWTKERKHLSEEILVQTVTEMLAERSHCCKILIPMTLHQRAKRAPVHRQHLPVQQQETE